MSQHVHVCLTDEQRQRLKRLIGKGQASARMQLRARILLLSDESQHARPTDPAIAQSLLCSQNTVGNIRRRFVHNGLDAALLEKARPGQAPKLTGEGEAHLIALACSAPPEGYARWTLKLLAGKLVELGVVESLSDVAVMKRLKKTNLNPGK